MLRQQCFPETVCPAPSRFVAAPYKTDTVVEADLVAACKGVVHAQRPDDAASQSKSQESGAARHSTQGHGLWSSEPQQHGTSGRESKNLRSLNSATGRHSYSKLLTLAFSCSVTSTLGLRLGPSCILQVLKAIEEHVVGAQLQAHRCAPLRTRP